jgi:hypothetical protein
MWVRAYVKVKENTIKPNRLLKKKDFKSLEILLTYLSISPK